MESLKSECRWCVWKAEMSNNRTTKVPYVGQDIRGKSNEPDTWLNYQSATDLKESGTGFDGLGFFLSRREKNSEYNLCVIDVDAHHEDEEVNPLADTILRSFSGTYAEKSPSGRGCHIICNVRANDIPLDCNGKPDFLMNNREYELEIYIGGFTNRYMTYTGNQISEINEITDQTEQVLDFLNLYMKKPEQERAERYRLQREQAPTLLGNHLENVAVDINERIHMARQAKYGKKIQKLV